MNTQLTPTSRRPRLLIAVAIALLVIIIGFVAFVLWPKGAPKTEFPLYYNFGGNYAFTVPAEHTVDEQSVPGIQLVYSGTLTVKTLADIYDAGGISVRAFTEKGDTKFRDYIDNTYLQSLKDELDTDDVQVRYGRHNGSDIARVTVKKDGADFRFFYLKDGKHPAAITAKNESDTAKKVAETLVDVEGSPIKDEVDSMKSAIQTIGEQARDQKVDELFDNATPALQANASKEQLANGIKDALDYLNGNVTVSGISLDALDSFSAAMRFTKLDDTEQKNPAFGSMVMKKQDGGWRLEALGLPAPQAQ